MGREPADALFKVTHSQTAASTAVRQRLPLLAATLLLVPLAILPVVLLRKPPDKTVVNLLIKPFRFSSSVGSPSMRSTSSRLSSVNPYSIILVINSIYDLPLLNGFALSALHEQSRRCWHF